jgi:menaquinone-dependent protoporphyrinogen oxidase
MVKRILVAYTTQSGSTEEVAKVLAEELGRGGAGVDVKRLEEVSDLSSYQAVVVGAPMILGWHRSALSFLKKHKQALAQKQTAYFATAMSLTRTDSAEVNGIPLWVDTELAKPPKNAQRYSLRERYALPSNYLSPMVSAAPGVKPVSVGFFGGKLELFRLPFLQMLFVMAIIQAQPGDLRNWTAVREWGVMLRTNFEFPGGEIETNAGQLRTG